MEDWTIKLLKILSNLIPAYLGYQPVFIHVAVDTILMLQVQIGSARILKWSNKFILAWTNRIKGTIYANK